MQTYEAVIYIDTSVRILSNELKPIMEAAHDVGMLTQFIGLSLVFYTNPKMFEWFGETTNTYANFNTIEANILIFTRKTLTSLIMKAWVTCALDKSCIAPVNSTTEDCCGCHRFDQDGLTIINSFFFGHPRDSQSYLPAYSLTSFESFFFEILRYQGSKYFD